MLFIEAIPTIKETKTSGTAISFKELIKIFPKGEIQSSVNVINPEMLPKHYILNLKKDL